MKRTTRTLSPTEFRQVVEALVEESASELARTQALFGRLRAVS